MIKFLRDVLLFSSLALFATVGIITLLNYLVETDHFYKIDDTIKYIVVGDSHPECAYNDSVIDDFMNVAQSAESYFYTYIKTKKILANNPNIETVFIEFNNGQLRKGIDNSTWDDRHLILKFPKYGIAMDWRDYSLLAKNNPSGLFAAQSLTIKNNFTYLANENRTMNTYEWGAYQRLTNNGAKRLKEFENVEVILDTTRTEYSKTNVHYLLKTIDVCKEFDVEVVLIRSPVHEKYMGRVNEITFRHIQKRYLKGIEFLDYWNYSLEDTQFADLHHLNNRGALQFSLYFNEELSRR
ncbi:MAG: hypothetical protein ACI837_002259 [Crocinitomicaceae bacterium]|jgi:hypothetical protein